MIAEYDKIIPNGADRILKLTESQTNHRLRLEDHAVKEQLRQSKTGQIFGFILALVCISASVYLAINDHDGVAALLGGSTIIGLITVFVLGRTSQDSEQKKDKDSE